MTTKVCRTCKIVKPPKDFHSKSTQCKSCKTEYDRQRWLSKTKTPQDKQRNREASLRHYHRHRSRQKTRMKDYKLRKAYGISLQERDILVKQQDGRCKLCQTVFESEFHTHVDHCHETGVIRGILCNKCNLGLGYFNDNPELLMRAIQYLEVVNE